MRGLRGIVLMGGLFATMACGTPDQSVNKPQDFWTPDVERELVAHIEHALRERSLDYVVHIHFKGRDWGGYRDLETKVKIQSSREDLPFPQLELPHDAGALEIASNFQDRSILLSLMYRYASAKKALIAFDTLFSCAQGRSPLLARTLVLGSGASHGVHELSEFGKRLKRQCGKGIDFAILSDAIAQPGPFPLKTFRGLEDGGHCLQFYQRAWDQLVKGDTLEPCTNVKVQDAYHFGEGGLTRYPEAWMSLLLQSINLSEPLFNMTAMFERIPFLREEFL